MPDLSEMESPAPSLSKRRLVSFPGDCSLEEAIQALDRDGAVTVRNCISEEEADTIVQDMQPYMDVTGASNNTFAGFKSVRCGALAARSPAFSAKVLQHPIFLGLAEHTLKNCCQRFHVMATQVIKILPGETAQLWHRDRQAWGTDLLNERVEPQLASMWALSDFTKENGATRVVLGTHIRPLDYNYVPSEDEICHAVMPRGSAVFYTGSALHSGGANVTENVERIGMHVSYAAAWLRQEENQYLCVPPEIAKSLEPRVQELLGYAMADKSLGYFSPPRLCDIPRQAENYEGFAGKDTVSPEFALGRRPRKEVGFTQRSAERRAAIDA